MSDEPEPQPRSWVPLAAAGGVAGLVLIVAVGWSLVAGGPSAVEADAIEACEAAYDETNGSPILGGEVYETDEYADYYAVADTHGEVPVPLEDVSQAMREQWQDAADAYRETGDGAVVVVWRLEDDTYRQCALPVAGGTVDGSEAAVNDLVIASEND
ncbi:hypothetical protein [Demequina activiva]|uniref:Uncharacterized protein n=1 Tax=Demequina activiva TaxID=1582364 RepID=A0A919Q377_9MICO|nr:hypothetical protein [Demequina activiva]GIG55432.1 hypothetical protein Dac01nite_21840 [Demequina activiva]